MMSFIYKISLSVWFNIISFSICAVPIILSFTKDRRKRKDWIYCRIAFLLMVFIRSIQILFNPRGQINFVSVVIAICGIVIIILMYKAYKIKE